MIGVHLAKINFFFLHLAKNNFFFIFTNTIQNKKLTSRLIIGTYYTVHITYYIPSYFMCLSSEGCADTQAGLSPTACIHVVSTNIAWLAQMHFKCFIGKLSLHLDLLQIYASFSHYLTHVPIPHYCFLNIHSRNIL